jgi:citrate lyase beta subunit
MKDSILCYSIGALLYCPANNESIVNSLVHEKFGTQYSLAFCLEDTIRDDRVEEAESELINSIQQLLIASTFKQFFMPKCFIRVREPQQISRIIRRLPKECTFLTGFIVPKFSMENADLYIDEIKKANDIATTPVYIMPILESPTMISPLTRYETLYALKAKLDTIYDYVLNIRVGGNDLCHMFGYRRHCNEAIYDILPISHILSDIMTIFGMTYVISGPVWEYYNGDGWDLGLKDELKRDKLNGFIGKTVIHPNQIPIVNASLTVSNTDYEDALAITNWTEHNNSLVSGNSSSERMNEYKTHFNWAKKILLLAQIYGVN